MTNYSFPIIGTHVEYLTTGILNGRSCFDAKARQFQFMKMTGYFGCEFCHVDSEGGEGGFG